MEWGQVVQGHMGWGKSHFYREGGELWRVAGRRTGCVSGYTRVTLLPPLGAVAGIK